ncbi:MAG: cytochrome c oxidase subunit II [Sphingopyxis sp.]|nr:cytochrome c oxidase subunit II [Sphingopyxis sp.]
MKMLKTLIIAATLATGAPALAQDAAAPAAPVVSAPAPATPAAVTAAPAADAAAPALDAGYVPMKPTDGIGQPVQGGVDFQPQATDLGQRAYELNNYVLIPIMTVVALVVLGLLFWVILRYRAKANPVPSKTSHNTLIEVIWTGVPALILIAIAFPSLSLLAAQYKPAKADAVVIKVKGYQWNWGYEYPDHGVSEYISKMLDEPAANAAGEPFQLAVDNRMVVPVGQEIKLLITGADVIHSFAVPALWTKMDAVPGRSNETTFTVNKPGVYYGQCSELCGVDHAFMPIAVEALPPEKFAAWVRSRGGKMPGDAEAAPAPAATQTAAAAAPVTATPAAAPAAAANN